MFKYLAAIALVTAGDKANRAKRVCVNNNAAFNLHWKFVNQNSGNESPDSGSYPINQSRCLDITNVPNVNNGDFLNVKVSAIAGLTKNLDTGVIYDPNAGTAVYQCSGATLTYSCKLQTPGLMTMPAAPAAMSFDQLDMDEFILMNLKAQANAQKKAAVAAAKQRSLDQLTLDFGMENEYTAIDMGRPVPFNGLGAYGSGYEIGYGEYTPAFKGAVYPEFAPYTSVYGGQPQFIY